MLTLLVLAAAAPPDVAALAKPGPDARAAYDRLSAAGPDVLLPMLKVWPADPAAQNWLRAAFEANAAKNIAGLPHRALVDFRADTKNPGKARRLVHDTLVRESIDNLYHSYAVENWIYERYDDAEFGADAVAFALTKAEIKSGDEKLKFLTAVFAAAADFEQLQLLAAAVTKAGGKPDVLAAVGAVANWTVTGPFPVDTDAGLRQSFPPEKGFDPAAKFPGKAGEFGWKPAKLADDLKVDLVKEGIKFEDGSVAYAAARVAVPNDVTAELRMACVDNVTAWVNGVEVFKLASPYRAQYRQDRHRAAVTLKAGSNTLLLKLTKTAPEAVEGGRRGGPAPKWDFAARLVGATGRGLAFTNEVAK